MAAQPADAVLPAHAVGAEARVGHTELTTVPLRVSGVERDGAACADDPRSAMGPAHAASPGAHARAPKGACARPVGVSESFARAVGGEAPAEARERLEQAQAQARNADDGRARAAPRAAPRASRELRDLLPDVCVRGPKRWPHARCAEHAALCDALDGVLDKLRGMGDLAAPFLARVTKADAPKYADVVKHPMDLGSMGRKLRQGVYAAWQDFDADVALIAANAAAFNGADSPYTAMAAQLRAAAAQLLAGVPVEVRDISAALARAEAEAAKAAEAASCAPAEADAAPAEERRGGGAGGGAECTAPTASDSPAGSPPAQTPESRVGAASAALTDSDGAAAECSGDAGGAGAHAVVECSGSVGAAAPPRADPDAAFTAELEPDAWRDCLQPHAGAPPLLPPLPRSGEAATLCGGGGFLASAVSGPLASDDAYARAALQVSLAPLLRRAGFGSANSGALHTLADATAAHMLRLCTLLRRTADADARVASAGLQPPGAITPDAVLACLEKLGRASTTWQRLALARAEADRLAAEDDAAPPAKRPHWG